MPLHALLCTYTLDPTPQPLHPRPYTSSPTPYALHSRPVIEPARRAA